MIHNEIKNVKIFIHGAFNRARGGFGHVVREGGLSAIDLNVQVL